MKRLLRTGLALAAAALLLSSRAHAQDRPLPTDEKPVVLLGFDGLSADRVERLVSEGKLPNLAALAARGGYSRLATSNPAQSPVAWASIITGDNPGGTGIYDFLRRVDYDPLAIDFAHAEKIPGAREIFTGPKRVLAICGAAALFGALGIGLALVVSLVAGKPALCKGKKLAGFAAGGAALGALAAVAVLRWIPSTGPLVRQLRSGEPLWVTLDRAGIRAVALEAPLCFPPEPMHAGCCVAGLGVPDMAGEWGTFSVWSDDPSVPAETETGGTGMYVRPDADAFDLVVAVAKENPLLTADQVRGLRDEAAVEAEKRKLSLEWTKTQRRVSETTERLLSWRARVTAKLPVAIRRGRDATVTLQDGTAVVLSPGAWSDLLPVVFEASPVTKLHGRVRLLLQDPGSGDPPKPFRLFVGQVQWDYAKLPPIVDLASPPSFAEELAAAAGPTETIGWPEMTNPVKDDVLSDREFLTHTYLVMKGREAKLRDRLKRKDFRLLFALFAEPDRVQHALYRHVDPQSPMHDPKAAAEFGPEIDKIYVEADRIVGDTVKLAGDGATVLVVSDHGFAPFRRGVNLNMFLQKAGYQASRGDAGQLAVSDVGGGAFFKDVIWPQTKAYSLGLGSIYVNLAGREPTGVVPAAQANAVLDGIAKDLLALRDDDGTKVVRRVYRGKDIYRGGRAAEAPDLVVGFEWGYRVSWQSCLGGCDPSVISPNRFRWSGDHCSVDPELVPGVLFSSVPLAKDVKPTVEDVAPTVLSLFKLAPKSGGRDVLAR